MKKTYKSMALAILMDVVSKTLTEIMEDTLIKLSPLDFTNCADFYRMLKRRFASIVVSHRQEIYDILSSAEFISKYPVMKKILKLPVSKLKKSIIFLSGIGCTTLEISHILQCEKRSVSTMRSSCRHYISSIFKH